jgi:hypothetical protein
MKSLLFFSSHFQTVSLVSKERQEKETETTMTLIFLTIALLGAASVRATDVLESIGFATYTGAGLSSTGANGALNSSLWRVDLVQDTNNDNTYGTNKTSAQASELGRGLVQANGQFSGGIGAVQINATTRALFLQPTSAFFTPGFVEFRTKFSSNTSANSLLDVTVRFFFFFFFFLFFFLFGFSETHVNSPGRNLFLALEQRSTCDQLESWFLRGRRARRGRRQHRRSHLDDAQRHVIVARVDAEQGRVCLPDAILHR